MPVVKNKRFNLLLIIQQLLFSTFLIALRALCRVMPICGLKLSSCGLLLSVWGFLQLALTGVAFHFRSIALAEDIKLSDSSYSSPSQLWTDLEVGYSQSAFNCWVASLLYLATFLISAQQFYMHYRVTEIASEPFTNFNFN